MSKRIGIKDIEFKFLSLHTEFASRLGVKTANLTPFIKNERISYQTGPCFHDLFCDLSIYPSDQKINAEISIAINKSPKYLLDNHYNNLIVVDKDTMIKHLEILKMYVPYEYNIGESWLRYKINCSLHECTKIQIKFLCCWIRYLYEFPSNVLLKDIYELYKDETWEYDWISPENLIMAFDILGRLGGRYGVRGDQCIAVKRSFMNSSETIAKLASGNNTSLNDLFLAMKNPKDGIAFSPFDEELVRYYSHKFNNEFFEAFREMTKGAWVYDLERRKPFYKKAVDIYLELSNYTRAEKKLESMKAENSYR